MTRITHPNLFHFAVLLTMTGLGVEAASLCQTTPLIIPITLVCLDAVPNA